MTERHAPDVVSLVFGTVFAGFTIVWLLGVSGYLDHDDAWWMGPIVLVVAGTAGLVASLRPGRDAHEPSPPDAATEG